MTVSIKSGRSLFTPVVKSSVAVVWPGPYSSVSSFLPLPNTSPAVVTKVSFSSGGSLTLTNPNTPKFKLVGVTGSNSGTSVLNAASSAYSNPVFTPSPGILASVFNLSTLSSGGESVANRMPVLPLLVVTVLAAVV